MPAPYTYHMKILLGNKGTEKWYPTYAPHIILGTNISILDVISQPSIYEYENNHIRTTTKRTCFRPDRINPI